MSKNRRRGKALGSLAGFGALVGAGGCSGVDGAPQGWGTSPTDGGVGVYPTGSTQFKPHPGGSPEGGRSVAEGGAGPSARENTGAGGASGEPEPDALLGELGLSIQVGDRCTATGGTWQEAVCECPKAGEGETRAQVFSTAEGCHWAVAELSECVAAALPEAVQAGDVAPLRQCRVGGGLLLLRLGSSALYLEGELSDEELGEFAQWLASPRRAAQLAERLPQGAGQAQSIVLQLGFPSAQDFPQQLEVRPHPLGRLNSFAVPIRRPLFVHSVAEMNAVLGLGSGLAEAVEVPPELAALHEADSSCLFAEADTYREIPILEGCLGACEVTAHCEITFEGEALSAARVRRYHGGTVFEERLELTTADNHELRGFILYDLSGEPNLSVSVTRGTGSFISSVATYDSHLRPLGHAEFDPRALGEAERVRRLVSSAPPMRDADTAVVVCESSFGPTIDSELAAQLVAGPHSGLPGQAGLSVFGWRQGAPRDAQAYFDGVLSTRFGIPTKDVEFLSQHAVGVARLALGFGSKGGAHSNVRLVPFDHYTCHLQPEVLRSLGKTDVAGQIRVINLSSVNPIDHDACAELYPNGLPEHFLWVVASGNWSRRYPDLASSHSCPQALSQRNNLIVVDGVYGDGLATLSDAGPRYSDIAAPCGSESGGVCQGTSRAAPRVAYVAARIVLDHGSAISNPMVRAALLLSARVPPSLLVDTDADLEFILENNVPNVPDVGYLLNRTSGIVDLEAARLMASSLVAEGWGELQQLTQQQADLLLQRAYEGQSIGGLSLPDFKLRKLVRNGFFETNPVPGAVEEGSEGL